jgi:hypothetical protein
MLTATPKSWVGWSFEISEDQGGLVDIDQAWFRERGAFCADGVEYKVQREPFFGRFALTGPAGNVTMAYKHSLLTRSFTITAGSESYGLRPLNVLSKDFTLLRAGAPVGSIRKRSWFSRTADVDLPQDLPLPVRIFIFWLVLLMWRRAANTSNGVL